MKTRFLSAALAAMLFPAATWAETETIGGIEWSFTIANGSSTLASSNVSGDISIPRELGGFPVTGIASSAFFNCSSLRSVDIPDTVRTIGPGAFSQCMNLEIVRISEGCTSIGLGAFDNDPKLKLVTIPSTILEIGVTAFRSDYNCTAILKSEHLSSEILSAARLADLKAVVCPLSLSPLVSSVIGAEKVLCFSDEEGVFLATIVSAQFRDNDSTILDVVYVVNSESPMVDIRFLAFEKGAIGFASVVRPESFVDGTEINVGDGVSANTPHVISWRVCDDWDADLSTVSVAVLAKKQNSNLLPMHLLTIPASSDHPQTTVSVNNWNGQSWLAMTGDLTQTWYRTTQRVLYKKICPELLTALLWLYASNDSELELENGRLRSIERQEDGSSISYSLVQHDSFGIAQTDAWDEAAFRHVFKRMGFRLITSSELEWVNNQTRLGLKNTFLQRHAIKLVQ